MGFEDPFKFPKPIINQSKNTEYLILFTRTKDKILLPNYSKKKLRKLYQINTEYLSYHIVIGF